MGKLTKSCLTLNIIGETKVLNCGLVAEKETERLDPTLVFEYEKSRDSVETNFRCPQREINFQQEKITSGSLKCSDDKEPK